MNNLVRTSSLCCGQGFNIVIRNCYCQRLIFIQEHRQLKPRGESLGGQLLQNGISPLAHFGQVQQVPERGWLSIRNRDPFTYLKGEILVKVLNFLLNWHVSTWPNWLFDTNVILFSSYVSSAIGLCFVLVIQCYDSLS